ncbi:phosphatidylinositol N-acetylglucosaminyltransferase subunit Gpi1p [Monosporozyma servazzii]
MVRYIFWPEHVYFKDSKDINEDLCAISIALESGDQMVLNVVPESLFRKQGSNNSILPPYHFIARMNNGQWSLNDDEACIICFVAPKLSSMQFLSLESILLTLPERQESISSSESIELLFDYERYEVDEARFKQSIDQVNFYYNYLLDFEKKFPYLCASTQEISILTKLMEWCKQCFVYKMIYKLLLFLVISACFIANQVSTLLNQSFSPFLRISVTARQIDLRCQQICYFPVQFLRINKNRALSKLLPRVKDTEIRETQFPCRFYPDYIRFYNTLWLMVNDISFGLIISAICHENKQKLVAVLNTTIRYCLYDFIKKITIQLADNPLGIKLNAELTHFLSDLFLWIINFAYFNIIRPLTEEKTLLKLITLNCHIMSLTGATFGLSLSVDFLSLCSFHIFLFYHIINKLYSWQLNAMINFYYLFRGKKKNKLRGRIDFNYFELDQLLMGTLLFIIMVYLTPTILAFYISYTCLRLCLIYSEISLESIITLINHFPLFALLLRVKDPKRLPGGVSFDIKHDFNGTYLLLENNPLKIGMLFKSFNIVLKQIMNNYCSIHTILNIIKGKPIIMDRNKLYYALYSSLPEKSVKISKIYEQLHDTIPV